ncbi:MAG: hypothetical protein HY699_03010 [Deltaproteobacteria bacterium]|nr:hypothetical protein [Deltaproteobacteria bacterium]
MNQTGTPKAAERLPRRIFPTVFLLSVAVLMVQIALSRIFSFTIWYHFAYISVSLALLGFGASGSMLAAFPSLGSEPIGRTIGAYSALCAVTTVVMLVVIGTVPLHPFEALSKGSELAKFVLYFLTVSVPFFFAGLSITIALRAAGPEVNRLYFWDLIGAGLGCALVVWAIDWLETPRVVMLVALLFALAGLIASSGESSAVRNWNLGISVVVLVLIGPLPGRLPFTPSKDKNISNWLQTGVTHYTKWSSIFRTDLMGGREAEADFGGYRRQGTSPRYKGEAPPYRMIVHDGGAAAIMYQVTGGKRGLEMFRHHVLTAPYVVRTNPEVLIIGVGGGADVINGLLNGAAKITGAELDPLTVDLITRQYRDFTGGIYDQPNVKIHASEGRHFVRSTDQRFDMIQITGVDTLAALSSGAYVLAENYLYTVDAYRDYFRVLRDDGLHSIGTLDFHPRASYPRHALRFAALSYDALRERGVARPHEHVMVVATRDGVSKIEVLTKLQPFSDAEITTMEQFIDENEFQAWYLPNRPARQQAVFRTLLEESAVNRERFFTDTFLDLRPPTDDRPFFFSYYKWRNLFEHRDEIDKGHTLATGQLVLVLILALAILFSIVAIALPMIRAGTGAARMPGHWGFLVYFAALGAGFIFAEICFVQKFILFLGYPTYSLTVMLFSFLTAAGIGAHLSGRLPGNPARTLPALAGVLTALVAFYLLALPPIFEASLAAGLAVKVVLTFVLCAPLGGLLGMFFPYGIRLTSALNRDFVAWAWAINGCLTVVGSVSSIIIAMTYGFSSVIVLFLAIYWLGVLSFVRTYARVQA